MKAWLAVALAAWLCAGCAQGAGGAVSQSTQPSGITMYGTIDQGVTFRK